MYNYVFSEIPNTVEGKEFVKLARKYLNRGSYSLRVKGQYLIEGENWRHYQTGQPINKSKCLRIYIDEV